MTTDDERKAAIRELEREIPDAYVESTSIGPTIILTKKSAETALAALRQQGPITDAQIEAAGQAIRAELRPERKDNGPLYLDHDVYEYRAMAHAAIEAARGA